MIYYIDPVNGSDTNVGSSPDYPFKTFAHFKYKGTGVAPFLHWGDTIALKRGTIIYDAFEPYVALAENDRKIRKPVVIAAYGVGNKPKISNARIINLDAFTQTSDGVWVIDMSVASNFSGYFVNHAKNYDVGFLKGHENEIYGNRKFNLNELSKKGDFYVSGTLLFVKSEGLASPYDFIKKIIVNNQYDALVTPCNNMILTDICLEDCAGHALKTNVKTGNSNILITKNEISDIGGAFWSGVTRMGNGVEVYGSAYDIFCFGNTFKNIFDTATTCQGNDSLYKNILFTRNYIDRCTNAFEVWCDNNTENTGVGYDGVYFTKNIVTNGGQGFGGLRGNTGDNLIGDGGTCDLKNLYVQDNVYAFPESRFFSDNTSIGTIRDNRFYGGADTKLDNNFGINDIDSYVQTMNNHFGSSASVINYGSAIELQSVMMSLNLEMSLLMLQVSNAPRAIEHEMRDADLSLKFTGGVSNVIKSRVLDGYAEITFTYRPTAKINAWQTFLTCADYRAKPSKNQLSATIVGNNSAPLDVFTYIVDHTNGFYAQCPTDMLANETYVFNVIFKTIH